MTRDDYHPCWCRALLGFVTHAPTDPCPAREHWLDVDDSELA